jgi:hypothetical protein
LVTGFNQRHVCIDSKQPVPQRFFKTRHDRHDNVQSHYADHDTQHRNDSNERNEGFTAAGAQVSKADEEFVSHQGVSLWSQR